MTGTAAAPPLLAGFLRRHGWLLIVLVALLLRWWGNSFGLPYIYTSDEAVTINRAVRFGTGDLNPHWFNYGTLNMYFLFANYGALYAVLRGAGLIASTEQYARLFVGDPTLFYLLARAWSGILAAAAVGVTFFLGRRWGGELCAWGAALLMAVNITVVDNAHSALSDPLMLLLMLWAVWEADGIRRSGGRWRYVRAGIAVGLAASTKYIPVLMFVAVPVAHLQFLRAQRLPLFVPRSWLPVIIAGVCAAAGFLAGTPYALLDAPTFLDYMNEWRVRGAAGVVFAPPDEPHPLVAMTTSYLPDAMGWPAFVLALAGIGFVLVRRPGWLAPYAAYGIVLVLFLAQSKQVTPRYPIPLYPLLSLLAAWIAAELAAYLQRNGLRLAATVAGLGLLLAALSAPAVAVVENNVTLTLPDTRTLMKQHIERTIPPETKILMDPFCPPLAQSRRLLTQLYQRAVAENHPKKDKFRLQLATLPPVTYEWYWTRHEKNTALPRDQEWSDVTIPYITIAEGIDAVRAQGIRYVVISSLNRDAYRTPWHRHLYPQICVFYDAVETQGTLLRREQPGRGVAQGPRLELYDIGVRR